MMQEVKNSKFKQNYSGKIKKTVGGQANNSLYAEMAESGNAYAWKFLVQKFKK